MSNKNLLLLSLEDAKIKKISNVISNDSCRKILDYLSKKDATESELAEKLQIPISTVHYNLQQLMETGLIESKEFHYSEKGKEVSHYKLANKYIIIAPKMTFGLKEKLKSILPVAFIASAAALFIQYFQKFFAYGGTTRIFVETKQTLVRETLITQKAAESAPFAKEAAVAGASAIQKAQEGIVKAIPSALQNITNKTNEYVLTPKITTSTVTVPPPIWQNIALWFFVGAIFALMVYFVYSVIKKNVE
ncbi:winged helix-turn-helix transcriptional regulator [Candidatus Woesearchaeota archaeon]|nr:winged helix-turn-helix transcriptional regulator [Candidatus Woesearchaeota archaeon]